jgi:hypothetical protein
MSRRCGADACRCAAIPHRARGFLAVRVNLPPVRRNFLAVRVNSSRCASIPCRARGLPHLPKRIPALHDGPTPAVRSL